MPKQTVTAFYENRRQASDAADRLEDMGVAKSDIQLSPENLTDTQAGTAAQPKGFWASLEEMFGGYEDHATYAEGVRRGNVMLTAHVDDLQVEDAIIILEQHGSLDMNERETSWRGEGWRGDGLGATTVGTTTERASPAATGMLDLGSVGTASAASASAQSDIRTTAAAQAPVAGVPASLRAGQDDVLQVVEEELKVGKRAVNRGRVRLHSYVVERPVSESVTLRDETVTVDRRTVDRPVGVANLGVDAFKERSVEMEEIDEEAVVSKSARVVEEISLRKQVADQVKTVTDTVRSTKVDIEDERTGTLPGKLDKPV